MIFERESKLLAHIYRLLKVNEIALAIGRTNKGMLELKWTKDKTDFEILLDAVPLDPSVIENKELKQMLIKYLWPEE